MNPLATLIWALGVGVVTFFLVCWICWLQENGMPPREEDVDPWGGQW